MVNSLPFIIYEKKIYYNLEASSTIIGYTKTEIPAGIYFFEKVKPLCKNTITALNEISSLPVEVINIIGEYAFQDQLNKHFKDFTVELD